MVENSSKLKNLLKFTINRFKFQKNNSVKYFFVQNVGLNNKKNFKISCRNNFLFRPQNQRIFFCLQKFFQDDIKKHTTYKHMTFTLFTENTPYVRYLLMYKV